MKFNSHVIFLIAIVGIITAGVVGATLLNNGSMKQVDFDGIKVNVPADADFIKTQDGYADAKYGITIKTFQNNQSMVNYLKGINGVTVVALKNQPPQSLAYVQGDNTNILVTNGGQGISIGAKDQGLVTDMSNSVVFSNHQKSVKPKVTVPGIAPPPHMELDVDYYLIMGILAQVNTLEFNVVSFQTNITPMIEEYNVHIDNGTINQYTANEFMPATSPDGAISDNQQQNTSLLDNPQASDVVSSLSSDSSNNAAGGDSVSSDSAPVISSDGSSSASSGSTPASSGSAPSISSDSGSNSGSAPSGDTGGQTQKLTKEQLKTEIEKGLPSGYSVSKIKDEDGYYIVSIKDTHGKIKKYTYDYEGNLVNNNGNQK